jgi:hypothetical protein
MALYPGFLVCPNFINDAPKVNKTKNIFPPIGYACLGLGRCFEKGGGWDHR